MKISSATFAGSSTKTSGRPQPRLPEIAFIGRSNVGKSSLINMLCSNGKLALTSATPGKTRLVNHFNINGKWYLVDLPGYGYAKMPPAEKAKLEAIIRDYLNHSPELTALFILVDCRHDVQKADLDFLGEVGGSDIPFYIIFTKGDKLGPVALAKRAEENIAQIREHLGELYPGEEFALRHLCSSAKSSLGRDEILSFISELLSAQKTKTT